MKSSNLEYLNFLIAVGKTTHTTHDTKNVVVSGVDTNTARTGDTSLTNSALSKSKLKSSVVDTRHVASAGRLVFFRFKTERINIDTGRRAVAVVLVRLDKIEVASTAFRKSVVAVKLKFARGNGIVTTVKNASSIVKTNKGIVGLSQVENTAVKGVADTLLNGLGKTWNSGKNS
jgi:hypothetical protein